MNRAATTLIAGLLCLTPAWAQSAFPPANSSTPSRRPNIGYNFGQAARNMQLFIDGHDFTRESNKNGNTINFLPAYDIDPGQHQVEARAINILGLPIRKNWSFVVTDPNNNNNNNNQQPITVTRVSPAQDSVTYEARPRIVADYPNTLRNGRVWLDGNEVTSLSAMSGGSLAFTPNQDLSPGRHQVATQVTLITGQTSNSNWTFEFQPQNNQNNQQSFTNLSPGAGTVMRNLRPYISADILGGVDNLRLLVDNQDVTNQSQRQGNRISWTPNYDLQPGNHGARVEGRTGNGQVVHQDWNFVVERGNQQPNDPNNNNNSGMIDFGVDQPLTGDRIRQNFNVVGHASPGRTVRVSLKPLPNKNKVAQFQGVADSNGNYSIPVTTPNWATRGMRLEVNVTMVGKRGAPATDPITLEVYRR